MPTEVLRGVRKVVGLANPTGHFRRRVRAVAFSTQWEPPTSIQRRSARKLGFLGPRLCDGFRVCVSGELRAFPASLFRARGSGEGGRCLPFTLLRMESTGPRGVASAPWLRGDTDDESRDDDNDAVRVWSGPGGG